MIKLDRSSSCFSPSPCSLRATSSNLSESYRAAYCCVHASCNTRVIALNEAGTPSEEWPSVSDSLKRTRVEYTKANSRGVRHFSHGRHWTTVDSLIMHTLVLHNSHIMSARRTAQLGKG